MQDLSAFSARPRLAALLDHFAKVKDTRQACKVMYPLREVLFLVVCGTIASGDDYDDIVDWGQAHLAFLRGFAEFHFAIPCADWLRCIMNRIDPGLFRDCFVAWVAECWPDKLDLVAIDGKTSRRTHNRRTGDKALHLVSAFATNSRLVLGQEAVFEKSNEITAIPALIERLDLVGALVSIDAMGCQVAIAHHTDSDSDTVSGQTHAGQIWVINQLNAQVFANGSIKVSGPGLVLGGGNTAGGAPAAALFATLSCSSTSPFSLSSTPIPGTLPTLSPNGDFQIDAMLSRRRCSLVPAPCS